MSAWLFMLSSVPSMLKTRFGTYVAVRTMSSAGVRPGRCLKGDAIKVVLCGSSARSLTATICRSKTARLEHTPLLRVLGYKPSDPAAETSWPAPLQARDSKQLDPKRIFRPGEWRCDFDFHGAC